MELAWQGNVQSIAQFQPLTPGRSVVRGHFTGEQVITDSARPRWSMRVTIAAVRYAHGVRSSEPDNAAEQAAVRRIEQFVLDMQVPGNWSRMPNQWAYSGGADGLTAAYFDAAGGWVGTSPANPSSSVRVGEAVVINNQTFFVSDFPDTLSLRLNPPWVVSVPSVIGINVALPVRFSHRRPASIARTANNTGAIGGWVIDLETL